MMWRSSHVTASLGAFQLDGHSSSYQDDVNWTSPSRCHATSIQLGNYDHAKWHLTCREFVVCQM